jgi:porin
MADHIYVVGGLADANGDPTDPGDSFDSFFDTAEYFSPLEIGWIPSIEQRYTDNIHLTAWHIDAREEAGMPSGWGLAFSWNRLFNDTWEPFIRIGYADDGGALWEQSASIGCGYHIPERNDLIGLGLNWGKPSEESFGPGLDDQYTAELFYRFQLMEIISLTPDVQLLVNPALNPDEDLIAVFGIRARLNF